MMFHHPVYAVFFACVLVGMSLLGRRGQMLWLAGASFVFYASWSPALACAILIVTAANHALGGFVAAAADSAVRKRRLLCAIAFNAGLLTAVKCVWFTGGMPEFARWFGAEIPSWPIQIILPVGVSFYIFSSVSYIVDVYYETIRPCASLVNYAAYQMFFPRILLGPITRGAEFLPQMDKPRRVTGTEAGEAAAQFFRGWVKKVCVADTLGLMLIDPVYADPSRYGTATLWLAFIAFPVQLYADFSGCVDMGMASARLLGFSLPVNFKNPLLAVNPQDFWRRWHITLTRWLTDYLFYFTFGGFRAAKLKLLFAVMATLLLCGLWHGANATFIIWGLYHGAWLTLHHIYRLTLVKYAGWQTWNRRGWYVWTSRIATYMLFTFGQVYSRAAPDLSSAHALLAGMAGLGPGSAQIFSGLCFLLLSSALIAHAWPLWSDRVRSAFTGHWPARSVAYAIALVFVMVTFISGVRPHIYMQF